MKATKTIIFIVIGILLYAGCSDKEDITASNKETVIPNLQKYGSATRIVVDGNPFLIVGGQLHNSSSGGSEYMNPIWNRLVDYHLNTVVVPAFWELLEPEEGVFEFTQIDSMILGARKAGLKLVIIWFGSWKNGVAPHWVKLDRGRFPLVKDEDGISRRFRLSAFYDETRDADAKAFATLMKHIREIDSKDHTVIMMQVENEMGVHPGKRDFDEKANKAFNGPVPVELMDYLERNKESLHYGLRNAWEKQGFRKNGTWEEVFGKGVLMDDWKGMSYLTEELFMAWNIASYVQKVASVGKAEYNIPMYVNAWIKQPGPLRSRSR